MEKISQSPVPNQSQNQSPVPIHAQSPSVNRKEELFNFSTAMEKVAEGKKISKKEWRSSQIYGELKDGKLILHKDDNVDYAWVISEGDLLGVDFIIID